jgi:hypothetical protein
MKELLPLAKAKLDPYVAEVKEHGKPLGHAAAYVGSCLMWIVLLPVVMVSAGCKYLALKLKPEPKVEEPKA